MIPAALALSAAMMNGTADFLGGNATRRLRPTTAVAWSQLLGLLVTLALAPAWGLTMAARDVMLGVCTGLALASALLFLYRGLARHRASVVSPVAAVTSAIVPVAWGLLNHERPSALVVAGVAVAFLAVLALSGAFERRAVLTDDVRASLLHGLGAGACFGVVLVLLSNTDTGSGLWPIAFARAAAVAVLLATIVSFGQFQTLSRRELPILVGCGALGVAGHAAVVVASGSGSIVVVGVLTSLYPAATVSLARIVDREKLSRWQIVGLPLALTAVGLMVVG